MSRTVNNSWLTRFALATAVATLVLIGIGGLVTSHEAGLSVPDWPTSYGYNMFLFPVSKWVGGILYEHTHRLVATIVGVLVVCLTRWLGGREACKPLIIIGLLELLAGFGMLQFAPKLSGAGYFLSGIGVVVLLAGGVWVRNGSAPPALQKLGWLAFVLVQIQGLLGGLRVVWLKDEIGIFHAALAQLFFVLLCAIALLSSRWWRNMLVARKPQPDSAGLRRLLLFTTLLIFGQLLLGATMRHQHAGLAIPDFPLAYHKLWPPLDANSIAAYNSQRVETSAENPITAFQIVLQMAHRFFALAILCLVLFSARAVRRNLGAGHPLAKLSLAWAGLILAQVILGAVTIWSNKAADIATAHVVTGALALANGALLTIISFRVLIPARATAPAASEPTSFTPGKPAASSAK
jgi:cytochrome c oxidase assembly protein subunit 15